MWIRRELTRQLDLKGVKGYVKPYRLPCRFRMDIALPKIRLGLVIGDRNGGKTPPTDWCVIVVSENGVKSGHAVSRLLDLIKARRLHVETN